MTPTQAALVELNKLSTSQAERNAIVTLAEAIARDDGYQVMIFSWHVRAAARCVLNAKAEART